VFERLPFDKFKEQMITKMVMRFPKLRRRVVQYLGDHYLVDVGILEATKQIIEGQETINNEKDICGFLDRNLTKRLDINKPLWEVHYFENYGGEKSNESLLILICHHSIGDGLSAQSALMCCSDEDYDPTSNPI
jgi:Wax ester synthase-like Acyl-CoA acyltransferase domain